MTGVQFAAWAAMYSPLHHIQTSSGAHPKATRA